MTTCPSLSRRPPRYTPVDWSAPGMPGAAIGPPTSDQLHGRHTDIMIAGARTASLDRLFMSGRRSEPTPATTRSTLSP